MALAFALAAACADPAPTPSVGATTGNPTGACRTDDDCPLGAVCSDGGCMAGCTAAHGCDGGKSCCDGACVDAGADAAHCGACGAACSSNNVSTPECAGGLCVGECDVGFGDCNDDKLADGCETATTENAEHCGGCGNACSNQHVEEPACSGGMCSGACVAPWADCNGDKLADGCETDLSTSVADCGGCGTACSQEHLTPVCVAGVCGGDCAPGFADCNDDKLSDGCEVDVETSASDCGGCGIGCSLYHIVPVCAGGVCVGACGPGFEDCNGDKLADGCEIDVASSVDDCGFCGQSCSTQNIAPSCVAGVCAGACAAGFDDCNGDKLADGCETDIASNAAACGGCGFACSSNHVTPACSAGVCSGACASGFADCNGDKLADGCEIGVATDPSHCGSCGAACVLPHATPACAGGLCQIGSCQAGYHDCDGLAANGCESVAATDAQNCGACGVACPPGLICKAKACVAPPCAGAVGLPGPRTSRTGAGPLGLAAADLDGDGLDDLVVANQVVDTMSVLLGHGDGTFDPHVEYPTGTTPFTVAAADLDGDGDADAAVPSWWDNNVGVFLNLGGGTFAPRVDFPAGISPESIVAADLDGDGDRDLAVTGYYASGATVLLNQGDGLFPSSVAVPIAAGYTPRAVAADDLDGDGLADLVVMSEDSAYKVHVFINQGSTSFGPPVAYASAGWPGDTVRPSIALADLNGDGASDIITNGNGASVLLNLGGGTFAPKVSYPTTGYLSDDRTLTVGDFDGDGAPDIAVAVDPDINDVNGNPFGAVSVLHNHGDGTFAPKQDYLTGLHPRGIVTGDWNGDGMTDLAATDYVNNEDGWRGNTVGVLVNLGDGTFPTRQDRPSTLGPYATAIGDLNGDGKLDVVAANAGFGPSQGESVSVFSNAGSGSFPTKWDLLTAEMPTSVAVTDLDEDADPDIVVACSGALSVLLNEGGGAFAPKIDYPAFNSHWSLAAADLNGDGRPDVAAINYSGDAVGVRLNVGGGTFGPLVSYPTGNGPYAVAAVDLNGDGKRDLAVTNYIADTVSVLLNQGGGVFAAKIDYPAGEEPWGIAAADLNGDGKNDLAIVNSAANTASVLIRQGNGFAPKVDYPVGSAPIGITAVDLDNDDDPDLVVTNYWGVSALLNGGGGTFAARWEYDTGGGPMSIAAGDLDGDGRPDLATPNQLTGDVTILLNRCFP